MASKPKPPSRTERQAYRWVARMIDDPQRYEAGLIRWIGDDAERLAVYNRVADATKVATWSASQIYERHQRELRCTEKPLRSAWAMAAVLLGLAATAIGIAHLVAPSRQPDVIIPPAEAYDAPAEDSRTIVLADGSTIKMGPRSHVETKFSRSQRYLVLTRGNAQFSVAHIASWPFVVSAGGGSVTAKGTIFEVAIGQIVAVKLLEGSVDVALPRSGSDQPVVRHLTAGGATRFQPITTEASRAIPPDMPAIGEPVPMKSFDDISVREVITEVNRQSPVQIKLADPTVGERKVVLDLHVGDTDDVAEGLASYLGLTVDRTRPGILLLRQSIR